MHLGKILCVASLTGNQREEDWHELLTCSLGLAQSLALPPWYPAGGPTP